VARRWLPYETTQSHLKPAGREDFVHRGSWIKPLAPGVEPAADSERIVLDGRAGETPAQLLVGRPSPIGASLCYRTDPDRRSSVILRYQGRAAEAEPDRGPGAYRLALGGPTARHPMWWTPEPWNLYLLAAAGAERGWFALDPACPPS
jgi:hypothetical protein